MNIEDLKKQIHYASYPQRHHSKCLMKKNPEVINILLKLCYEPIEPLLQQEAVRILSALIPDEALNVFTKQSQSYNDSIRLKSFYHLGTLGNPKGINAVLKGLLDHKPFIRKAAAISAGRLGIDYQAINALKQVLNPLESKVVKKEAEKSISNIKKRINLIKKKNNYNLQ